MDCDRLQLSKVYRCEQGVQPRGDVKRVEWGNMEGDLLKHGMASNCSLL